MYLNKCTKCGAEFETKNPKRVICPDCLYPEKNTVSLQSIENSLDQPKTDDNQPDQNPSEGQGERPNGQFVNAYRNNRGNSDGGGYNNNRGNYNGGGGGYNQNRGNYNGGGYNNNRGNYNSGGGGYNQNRGNYNGGGYNNNRGNYNSGGGGYNQNRGNYGNSQGGGNYGGGPRPGGFNNGPRPGGFNNGPRQGGFGPRPGGFNRGGGNAFRRPMSRPKQLLISREQVAQIEVLYKRLLPLPNPDAHEVIGLEIGLEPNKTFFGINLVREKLMLPKLPYPKRKLAVSPDQLMAIKNLYEPLLPTPPIGCHKILAAQLKMDEWRVHVGIGLVRKQLNMPRWNPDRPDAPEEFKNQAKEKESE